MGEATLIQGLHLTSHLKRQGSSFTQHPLPIGNLIGMYFKLLSQFGQRLVSSYCCQRFFFLKIPRVFPSCSFYHLLLLVYALLRALLVVDFPLKGLFKFAEPLLSLGLPRSVTGKRCSGECKNKSPFPAGRLLGKGLFILLNVTPFKRR